MRLIIMAALCAVMSLMGMSQSSGEAQPLQLPATTQPLSLHQALQRTLDFNPDLKIAEVRVQIKKAQMLHTKLRINPELQIETEDFGGRNDRSGFDQAETTVSFAQTLELGGKRLKRQQAATFAIDLAAWDQKTVRLELFAASYRAFVDVLASQMSLDQEKEKFQLAEQIDQLVKARIEAGKVSPLEGLRSEVALEKARLLWTQAEYRFAILRNILASFWGQSEADFQRAEGILEPLMSPPEKAILMQRLDRHPQLARWKDEKAFRDARLRLEQSRKIPNLTVTAGWRTYQESGDNAWVLGASLPLQLFNRNKNKVLEMRYRVNETALQKIAIENQQQRLFSELYASLLRSYAMANTLKNQILPTAQKAFEGASEGYREGKFPFLDVLQAQRIFFETKSEYTDILQEYHLIKIDLEELLATDFWNLKLGEWING